MKLAQRQHARGAGVDVIDVVDSKMVCSGRFGGRLDIQQHCADAKNLGALSVASPGDSREGDGAVGLEE